MKYVAAYVVALVLFLILDFIWLGLVAKGFYAARMGSLMLAQPRWAVAIAFYLIYTVGIVYFAVSGAMASASWSTAARDGLLFGFFTYLTYDATSLAVVRGYDGALAVVDTVWGAILGAIVAGGTILILNAFGMLRGA